MINNVSQKILKNVAEYAPLVVFFVFYYIKKDLFWATGGLLVATVVSIIITIIMERKLPFLPIFTAVAVSIFGGLTLLLKDDIFIKIRPTVVNLIFAVGLLAGLWKDKLFLKMLLGKALDISEKGWRILTIRWAIFFMAIALLNEIVWRTQTEEFWVNFKVLGVMGLNFLFLLIHIPLLQKHQIKREDKK